MPVVYVFAPSRMEAQPVPALAPKNVPVQTGRAVMVEVGENRFALIKERKYMSSIRSHSVSGVGTLILFMCLFPVQGQTQSFVALRPSSPAKRWLREPSAIPGPHLIQPDELVGILKSASVHKPLIIQVGFRVLYLQAHIPGSEYLGPASRPDGIQKLRKRLQSLRRTRSIVIYCGCCPWHDCPNVHPAYKELRAMGFKNVKVLYIAQNFGSDWVYKGYPVVRGK